MGAEVEGEEYTTECAGGLEGSSGHYRIVAYVSFGFYVWLKTFVESM